MSALPNPLVASGVDWPAVFTSLRNRGLSVYTLAERTGISRSALRDYGAGISQPRHHIGELIIGVWMTETRQAREVVPLTSSYFNYPPMI